MAAKVEIVEANLSHLAELVRTMRLADQLELWAASRSTPAQALANAVRVSDRTRAGLIDGEVACLFGVAPQSRMTGAGYPWLLGSELIEQHPTLFLRRSRRHLTDLTHGYTYLHNWVDARNTLAVRWLAWLGFEMGEPAPHGIAGLPFRHFEMRFH